MQTSDSNDGEGVWKGYMQWDWERGGPPEKDTSTKGKETRRKGRKGGGGERTIVDRLRLPPPPRHPLASS